YVSALANNAAYLGRLGIGESDVTKLLAFELQQAAGLRIFRTLAKAVDARVKAPGLSLVFARSFGMDIVQRYEPGPLGRGWAHNWQRSLTRDSDGTVKILGPNVAVRVFQPDSRSGAHFTEQGDYGTLSDLGNGVYSVRERLGNVTCFRS